MYIRIKIIVFAVSIVLLVSFGLVSAKLVHAITTTPTPRISQQDVSPAVKNYCMGDEPGLVHMNTCDNTTRCRIAYGSGGPSSSCGSVIGWEHTIFETLSENGTQSNTSRPIAFSSNCYKTTVYSPYISTFAVIDAYNLAGFKDFSRGTHASAPTLISALKTTANYITTTAARSLTPGDVVMFNKPAHVGIVNTVDLDSRGDGAIWFLHANAAYPLGKLVIADWEVVASSTGDIDVVFGSHQSKGPDTTTGETVCY